MQWLEYERGARMILGYIDHALRGHGGEVDGKGDGG